MDSSYTISQLALLLEDASDFRAAREHLQRVVLRGTRAGLTKPLVERLDERIATAEKDSARLLSRLNDAR